MTRFRARVLLVLTFAAATATEHASAGGRGARQRPDRVAVPAGAFVRGSLRGEDDERPRRSETLRAFVIDRTEVTRAAYAACVAAHRCHALPPEHADPQAAPDATAPAGADAKTDPAQLPVTWVSWSDARDYCRFAGARLPTEAEWEKAARGTDGREYPWGDEADCSRGNWGNYAGEGPCAGTAPGHPTPVGSYPQGASPVGAQDMGGNVWEWVSDKYDEDAKRRVVKGGSCCSYFVGPRAANRNAWDPAFRDGDLGFRCAASR